MFRSVPSGSPSCWVTLWELTGASSVCSGRGKWKVVPHQWGEGKSEDKKRGGVQSSKTQPLGCLCSVKMCER